MLPRQFRRTIGLVVILHDRVPGRKWPFGGKPDGETQCPGPMCLLSSNWLPAVGFTCEHLQHHNEPMLCRTVLVHYTCMYPIPWGWTSLAFVRQGRDERRVGSNLTEWIDHDTGKLEVQFSNL